MELNSFLDIIKKCFSSTTRRLRWFRFSSACRRSTETWHCHVCALCLSEALKLMLMLLSFTMTSQSRLTHTWNVKLWLTHPALRMSNVLSLQQPFLVFILAKPLELKFARPRHYHIKIEAFVVQISFVSEVKICYCKSRRRSTRNHRQSRNTLKKLSLIIADLSCIRSFTWSFRP